MNTVTIRFKADNQELKLLSNPVLFASNTVSYVLAEFELGENWEHDTIRAIWYTDTDRIATVLNNGSCTVPHEVLAKSKPVMVNLVGSDMENSELVDRLTTYPIVAFVVNADAKVDGTETAEVTPSQFEQFVSQVEELVESVKDIDNIVMNDDYTLTINYSDGTHYTTPSIRGAQGEVGATPDFSIGTVETRTPDEPATATITGTAENPVLNLGIPQGTTGNGIDRIAKTETSGYVDTYTIYYTNGTTTTFTVTNGEVSTADLQNAITPLQYVDYKSQVQVKSAFADKISLINVNVQTAGKQGGVGYLNLAYKSGNEAVTFGGQEVLSIPQEICPSGNTILFATIQSGTTLTSCYIRKSSSSIVIYGTLNANAELRLMGFYAI